MRMSKPILTVAVIVVAAIVTAPTLFASDDHEPPGPAQGGMIGQGHQRGQISQMMDHCGSMMQRGPHGERPNDQWRKNTPAKPDKDS